MERIKCVVVGDTNTGKTSLIRTFTTVTNPGGCQELHTEFTVFKTQIRIGTTNRELDIYDCLTSLYHNNLASALYSNANLFLICFSVLNRDSFENARHHWLTLVLQYNKQAPIIMIGTKIDMRIPGGATRENYVTRHEGLTAAKQLNLNGYFECTALEHKIIEQMFKNVVRSAQNHQKPSTTCSIQ